MYTFFDLHMPTRILFEAGAARTVGTHIPGSSVLIMADPFLLSSGVAGAIGDTLTDKRVAYFDGIEPNPSCESIDEAAQVAREMGADCVIGLGGGSVMDAAKMVACLAGESGSIYDYYQLGQKGLQKRRVGLILIPTTAGTGSEVTNVGVFTSRRTGKKLPMASQEFWADLALLDPELTYSMPGSLTAATGMDAFTHAIEAYWNLQSNPISSALAQSAIKMILQNIKVAYDQPGNQEARAQMLMASTMAGIAFSQTKTTGIHALSYPFTMFNGVPHGVGCALTLPVFIRLSVQRQREKMQHLVDFLGFDSVEALADHVHDLMAGMNLPLKLSEVGVTRGDFEKIAESALSMTVMIERTPAQMDKASIMAVLEELA
ncbi:MAG: iron-containing alcohol dehydrogenase [Christensenellales bacterium]